MSSDDDPVSADRDGDGQITVEELIDIEEIARTSTRPARYLRNAIAKARGEGARLTQGARNYFYADPIQEAGQTVDDVLSSIGSLANFVVNTVMSRVVKPLFTAFYWVPVVLAAVVSMLFWGQDLALEERVQGWPGIADLPIAVSNLIHDATAPIGSSILVFVRSTNRTLVLTFIQEGGGLAPVLIAGLGMLELGILVALLWSGVQLAGSLPVVSTLVAGGKVVTRPFRGLLRRFR